MPLADWRHHITVIAITLTRDPLTVRLTLSLTAAPCTEGVRWIVMKQPLTLSAVQLARLGQLMAPNARPVQPLHGRVVSESL